MRFLADWGSVDAAEASLGGQTPVFFLSSHDHPRQWSVFGDGEHNDQIAKLTAAMTLLVKGTALMYYGEEIGMATLPKSALKDFPTGPKRPRADDRDGARTPMQWDGGKGAGFTKGLPWLPIEPGAKQYNVAAEKDDSDSIYNWYEKLLKLRHDNAAFREGDYVPLESGNAAVIAFGRKTGDGQGAVVVLNTSGKEEQVNLTAAKLDAVLMASPAARMPASTEFSVAPFGVVVLSSVR